MIVIWVVAQSLSARASDSFCAVSEDKAGVTPAATSDVWETMSTARTIRRFTDEPVDDETLRRCLEAATWAPSGANAQAWRFIVLRSATQRAVAAQAAAGAELAAGVGTLDDARAKEDPQAAGLAAWSLVHGFAMLWLNDAIDREADAVATAQRVARMLFTPGPVGGADDE